MPAGGYFVVNNDRVLQLKSGRLLIPAARHNVPITPGESGADVVAIARYWCAQGDEVTALAHLQAHERQLNTTGLLALAALYKRRRLWAPAVSIWHRLAACQCVPALEHLAKYYEHVQYDYPTALALACQLQTLEHHKIVHLQRVRRLVAKMHS